MRLKPFKLDDLVRNRAFKKTKNEKGVCQYGCLEQQMDNESFKEEDLIKEQLKNQTEQKKANRCDPKTLKLQTNGTLRYRSKHKVSYFG